MGRSALQRLLSLIQKQIFLSGKFRTKEKEKDVIHFDVRSLIAPEEIAANSFFVWSPNLEIRFSQGDLVADSSPGYSRPRLIQIRFQLLHYIVRVFILWRLKHFLDFFCIVQGFRAVMLERHGTIKGTYPWASPVRLWIRIRRRVRLPGLTPAQGWSELDLGVPWIRFGEEGPRSPWPQKAKGQWMRMQNWLSPACGLCCQSKVRGLVVLVASVTW